MRAGRSNRQSDSDVLPPAECRGFPRELILAQYGLHGDKLTVQADLFSNKRDYLDSLDVDDIPAELMSPSSIPPRPMSTFSTTSTSTPSLASIGSSASSSQLPTSPVGHSAAMSTLHCTLFLFDDKLILVKRQSSAISGRNVTGLNDVQKLVKSGGGVAVMDKNGAKKDKLSYRGMVDVLDVIASDVGNGGEFEPYHADEGQS